MKENYIRIIHKTKIAEGTVDVPSSKSISNRALIIRSAGNIPFRINHLSGSGDTVLLDKLLKQIDLPRQTWQETVVDARNAGTTYRFLTALLSIKPGFWKLTGDARMKERPVADLVAALRQSGASIQYVEREGYPPLLIEGKNLDGGEVVMSGGISSQFISALLMMAPVLPKGIILRIKDKVVSRPYVEMTLRLMSWFGVNHTWKEDIIAVPRQNYLPGELTVECDWSSASYWYSVAALSERSSIMVAGLQDSSLQGDARIKEIFQSLGVETIPGSNGMTIKKSLPVCKKILLDFTEIPDLAQTVITTTAAMNAEGVFTGLETLRHKETDRVAALVAELGNAGFRISVMEEGTVAVNRLELNHYESLRKNKIRVNTYGDHRMALAFAPLAMFFREVRIENPGVVDKSYPSYWEQLLKTGFFFTY